MNRYDADILKYISKSGMQNQRTIAKELGLSLGTVNKSIKNLTDEEYLDTDGCLKDKSKDMMNNASPNNAIILAAGYGMRMVPINTETPKGLITVRGEALIERIINQLKEVGIEQIYVVVGYMKEAYEYLIDDMGVKLIVNSDYGLKNNLHSLMTTSKYIDGTYIVPCDIWCEENPFDSKELYSWYMLADSVNAHSTVRVNRKNEIVTAASDEEGNTMIGIAYIHHDDSELLKRNLQVMDGEKKYDSSFWEDALLKDGKMQLAAKVVNPKKYVEINTYEQLRELDTESLSLKSEAIEEICKALKVSSSEVNNIDVLKKGMTNRSFLFSCKGKRYIMRIPGEGTEELINRKNEAFVYNTISGSKICDDIAYINPKNGYKITEYLEGARVCNPTDEADLKKCMKKLRDFHDSSIRVEHEFDIFGQIEFYESLWKGEKSIYRDYLSVKESVMTLREYVEANREKKCLTHIDAVPDNFLFYKVGDKEEIRLIDWEYAGMQDPHVDIAMFCIYSLYDREQIDRLIDIYFEGKCPVKTRKKIYCYIAMCGLLWSNWCEYKRQLGVEFGEYSLRQYRYAKEFVKIAREMQINE